MLDSMTWTAKGQYDGEPFELTWDSEAGRLTRSPDPLYVDLLAQAGQEFTVPPTGPTRVLDLSDPASVLTAIMGSAALTDLSGDDVPTVVEPVPAGAIP